MPTTRGRSGTVDLLPESTFCSGSLAGMCLDWMVTTALGQQYQLLSSPEQQLLPDGLDLNRMTRQHLVSAVCYCCTHVPSQGCFHQEHDFVAIVQYSSQHKPVCISLTHQSLESCFYCSPVCLFRFLSHAVFSISFYVAQSSCNFYCYYTLQSLKAAHSIIFQQTQSSASVLAKLHQYR